MYLHSRPLRTVIVVCLICNSYFVDMAQAYITFHETIHVLPQSFKRNRYLRPNIELMSLTSGKYVERKINSHENKSQQRQKISRREFLCSTAGASTAVAISLAEVHAAAPSRVGLSSDATDSDSAMSIPFSSTRKYRYLTLSNGLRVVLASDRRTSRQSASLSSKFYEILFVMIIMLFFLPFGRSLISLSQITISSHLLFAFCPVL